MTTTSTKLTAAGLVPHARPNRQHRADSGKDCRGGWRLALNSAWQRKIDEVITLSMASGGLTSDAEYGLADQGGGVSSRLHARTERAYYEVAAIEEAIARIDAGTYGMCTECRQHMADEWLADKPENPYCPDCSLRLVKVSAA
jgi:RNA polymerase-binding transcription factor DksA